MRTSTGGGKLPSFGVGCNSATITVSGRRCGRGCREPLAQLGVQCVCLATALVAGGSSGSAHSLKATFQDLLACLASGGGQLSVDRELRRHPRDHPFDRLIQACLVVVQCGFAKLLALRSLGPVAIEGPATFRQLMLTGPSRSNCASIEANIGSSRRRRSAAPGSARATVVPVAVTDVAAAEAAVLAHHPGMADQRPPTLAASRDPREQKGLAVARFAPAVPALADQSLHTTVLADCDVCGPVPFAEHLPLVPHETRVTWVVQHLQHPQERQGPGRCRLGRAASAILPC